MEELKKLHELCKPIMEYLRENHTPHECIIITDSGAKLLIGSMFVPFKLCKKDTD